jgi:uncharacterized protein
MKSEAKHSNHLIHEESPYLQQHAYNPVNWYPWGKSAFDLAAERDVPIFLSIGYSTCHWCHVMELECFESLEVAALLNKNFVCVKVDREERPDIDAVYMRVCQLMTGSGGWPLTIVMTPNKVPFFAGTYIPKNGRHGRTGLLQLLPRITGMWNHNRDSILATAAKLQTALSIQRNAGGKVPGKDAVTACDRQLAELYDSQYGGFGSYPKFPTPHQLFFLFRHWKLTGSGQSRDMALKTLEKMEMGGIRDHLDGGFHRYSTDRKWLVPHFEKMLYDQALLAIAYLEAWQISGKKQFYNTMDGVLSYVSKRLTSPTGGFYSAEDADSEGLEGTFYLWSTKEVRKIVGTETAPLIVSYFNMNDNGNFQEPDNRGSGNNILYTTPESENQLKLEFEKIPELGKRFHSAIEKLKKERASRPRPFRDDKILCDWNGWMISAYSRAHSATGNADYLKTARNAADFILNNMWTEKTLYHRHIGNQRAIPGFLDDYASLAQGLLDLYEADYDVKWLQNVIKLARMMVKKFHDPKSGGFYNTSDREELLFRQKDASDSATPSGNSVAFHVLTRLGKLTGNVEFSRLAETTSQAFSRNIEQYPTGFCYMLSGICTILIGPAELVAISKKNVTDTHHNLNSLRRLFLPNLSVLAISPENTERIAALAPFTKGLTPLKGKLTYYLCRDFACAAPTTSLEQIIRSLRDQ